MVQSRSFVFIGLSIFLHLLKFCLHPSILIFSKRVSFLVAVRTGSARERFTLLEALHKCLNTTWNVSVTFTFTYDQLRL